VRAVAPYARRRAAITIGIGAAAAGLFVSSPVVAASTQSQPTAAPVARVTDDPLAVYFRHDVVGRAQLSLAATACGTERWTVKTGTDDDRHRVRTGSHDVSIRFLRNRTTPAVKPQTQRVAPVETTTYRVHARLTDYVREDDGDYHLVLSDKAGRTIIAEIPDPKCVASISPFRAAIRTARTHMDAHLSVTSGFKAANQRVVVRGVGFFDYFHGQTGMAPNDLELHPVTGLRFR
jgi:hypothetical protein